MLSLEYCETVSVEQKRLGGECTSMASQRVIDITAALEAQYAASSGVVSIVRLGMWKYRSTHASPVGLLYRAGLRC